MGSIDGREHSEAGETTACERGFPTLSEAGLSTLSQEPHLVWWMQHRHDRPGITKHRSRRCQTEPTHGRKASKSYEFAPHGVDRRVIQHHLDHRTRARVDQSIGTQESLPVDTALPARKQKRRADVYDTRGRVFSVPRHRLHNGEANTGERPWHGACGLYCDAQHERVMAVPGARTVDIICFSERASWSQVDHHVGGVPLVSAERGRYFGG
jgi:hypothetical protein